jgi:hypothetical protein
VEAEIIYFEAEKRALVLKEAAISESEKGRMEKIIEEKDKVIEEMTAAKKEAEKKVSELQKQVDKAQASIDELRIKTEALLVSGIPSGGGSFGPMEYAVEHIIHTNTGEVDVATLSKTLIKRSSDGWKLHSLINDEGGRILASLGNSENFSLATGVTFKEDRIIMIFERPAKK